MRWAWFCLLGSLFVVAMACDPAAQQAATATPPEGGGAAAVSPGGPGNAAPGVERQAAAKPVVRARDRDPEEERRKMSLSRGHSEKARVALRAGSHDNAVREARQALRAHEQNVEAMLVIAEVFYKQGKYEIVQSITSSVLDVDPRVLKPQESSRAYNLKGFAFLAEGNQVGAMRAFRKAAELDEKNAAAWNNLGVRYMAQEEFQIAASCFSYAIQLDPGFYKAHLNHGAALRAQGKLVEAERTFQKVLGMHKNYPEAHFNLGVLYLDAEAFPQLDTTARLNRAIREFTRYKQLAMGGRPGTMVVGPGASRRPGGPASQLGTELVSPAQADLYIGVAKKGLEREQRRQGRAATRKVGGGESAAEAPQSPTQQPAQSPTQQPAAQQPTPKQPTVQGPSVPSATRQRPPPKAPPPKRKPTVRQQPAVPNAPGNKSSPQKPPAQKPPAQKPPAQKPPAQKPAPRKPAAQRPAPQKPTPQAS